MSTYIGTKRQPCRLVLVQKSSNTILYMSRLRFGLRGLKFFTASTPSHSRSRREILRPQLHGGEEQWAEKLETKRKVLYLTYPVMPEGEEVPVIIGEDPSIQTNGLKMAKKKCLKNFQKDRSKIILKIYQK